MTDSGDTIVKGRILLVFRDGVSYKQSVRIIERLGYSVIQDAFGGYYPPLCIAVPEGHEQEAIKAFQSIPEVERACLDRNAPFPQKKRK